MTLEAWLTILAVFLAPLIAIQASEFLTNKKESKKRKLEIFRVLMATRRSGMPPQRVEAMNRIDLEFYGEKKVIEAWRLCQDHLSTPSKPAQNDEEGWRKWGDENDNFMVDLLYSMSTYLGYNFDKVFLKRGHYHPQVFVDLETEQAIIRKGMADIFSGKKAFPIKPMREEEID